MLLVISFYSLFIAKKKKKLVVYESDDDMISRNTEVIVSRVPAKKSGLLKRLDISHPQKMYFLPIQCN